MKNGYILSSDNFERLIKIVGFDEEIANVLRDKFQDKGIILNDSEHTK